MRKKGHGKNKQLHGGIYKSGSYIEEAARAGDIHHPMVMANMGPDMEPQEMVLITCPGCGGLLQVPKRPRTYRCPAPRCRADRHLPCDRCDLDRNGMECPENSYHPCIHDDGRYDEACMIVDTE